jgi:hypothetical protein
MALLCALLLQNCQPHSVRITEEEKQAVDSSLPAVCQRAFSEPLAVRSLTTFSGSSSAHIPPARSATIPAHEEDRSTAPSAFATMGNSPTAPYDLPTAATPGASHVVPLGNAPGPPSPVFTTSSGECIRFGQVDGQWRAAMQTDYGSAALQRTLPVVGPADVSNFLSWLQDQDKWTSRARIHILKMPQAPYGLCVYLGRVGLLGGMKAFSFQEMSQGARTAPLTAFGAEEWRHYFGEIGETPPLPTDIEATLDAPCPFWQNKKVRDTHLLVLIPATVEGAPFTLNRLGVLVQHFNNGGHKTKYRYYASRVQAKLGATFPPTSYWLLMTRDVLPGSRSKTYAKQKEELVAYATGLPYELPKALEAATAILTHYVRYGERLYSSNPSTYTNCQELMDSEFGDYPAVVGGFESSGLAVSHDGRDALSSSSGVAGCRKFCVGEDSETTLANKQDLFTASSMPVTVSSSLAALNLAASARPRVSHVVPLGEEPVRGRTPSPDSFRVSLGEAFQDDELDKRDKKVSDGEREKQGSARRDALNAPWAMDGSELDKHTEYLRALFVVVQNDYLRRQALEALNKVAKTSPDMFSECLPSLRTAAKGGNKEVRLFALKTLGEAVWRRYFGEIGPVPDLPSDMAAVLDSGCSFWPGKKVRDTHLLVLIPATVDNQPFSLNLLGELIQHPKNGGHKTQYRCYDSDAQAQLGAASPTASYWLLMTRDVLPESRGKTDADQKELVADRASQTGLPYELPKALEAATAILTHHVRNGERLYSDNPRTYTRCQECVLHQSGEYPAVVGGFESSGLGVRSHYCDFCDDGIAGCWRFCEGESSKTTSANKQGRSTALSTRAIDSPAVPDLPVAVMLMDSRAESLDDEPLHAPSRDHPYCGSVGGVDKSKGASVITDLTYSKTITSSESTSKRSAKQKSSSWMSRFLGQEVSQGSRTALPVAFGPREWSKYYGEVGAVPPLPTDIEAILDAPCPFWPDRRVRDTHLLVLLPATVNGKPFTLNLLSKLIKSPKWPSGGHKTQYLRQYYYGHAVQEQIGNNSPDHSYWLLMTRDVLPESRNKTYSDQKELITDHASRTGLLYELPKALEAATAILTHYVRSGERLYNDNPWTYTRCQELVFWDPKRYKYPGERPVVVGGFASSGLGVRSSDFVSIRSGVAGFRKF